MRDKRGFIGAIFLAVLLVIGAILLFLYFQIRANGIQLKTGNIVIDINYQKPEIKEIINITSEINETQNYTSNITNELLNTEENSSLSQEELLIEEQ